jgi:hypothetical protein
VLLSRFHKSQPNATIFRVGRRAFTWTIHRSAHRPPLLSPHSSPHNGTANMLTNATDHLSIFSYLSQRQLPNFNVQQPRHHSPLSAALRRSRQLRLSEQKQYKLTTSCSTTARTRALSCSLGMRFAWYCMIIAVVLSCLCHH